MANNSVGTQDDGTFAIGAQGNSTSPQFPAPPLAKKELHVDPEYPPEKPEQPPLVSRREPNQPIGGPEIAHATSVPSTPRLIHADLPARSPSMPMLTSGVSASGSTPAQSYRPRVRKVTTKEISPTDSQSVTVLGLSPFMPGQDAMYNQNRLVRNEVVLARHLSRLQQLYQNSESNHAQRSQDVYRVLTDHKGSIDLLKNDSLAIHPEFTALVEAHNDTRRSLEDLTKDIASFSSSTRRSIDYLTDAVRRLTSPFSKNAEPILDNTDRGDAVMAVAPLSSSPRPLETFPLFAGIKRKRSASILSLSLGIPTTSQASTSAVQTAYLPQSNVILHNSGREVIYGPIKDEADLSNPIAAGNDAIRGVGLSPSMIHSIRVAPGRPGYLSMRFLKYEYASRFVDLVPFGEHPDRQAFLVDGSVVNADASTTPSGLKQKSQTW